MRVKFQFPPNGKAHANNVMSIDANANRIQFQFPPNGKAHANKSLGLTGMVFVLNALSFNSLQTGRHMRTLFY